MTACAVAYATTDAGDCRAMHSRSEGTDRFGSRPELIPVETEHLIVRSGDSLRVDDVLKRLDGPISFVTENGHCRGILVDPAEYQLLLAAAYLASNPKELAKLHSSSEDEVDDDSYSSFEAIFSR